MSGERLCALPIVPKDAIDRSFFVFDMKTEVTSMDIAAHGALLVVGTSSGMILLFDLSNPLQQSGGLLIGQIRAKGMHTSLLMTIKFSDDSRFCFAGVTKGSSEMLAIDLGHLLVEWKEWRRISAPPIAEDSSGPVSDEIQQQQLQNLVTYSHSDAKLRGFDAVVHIMSSSDHRSESPNRSALYRLACGKGIKNVHVWHFHVERMPVGDGSDATSLLGRWECVYDVASNGNTITNIEFRNFGRELLSKSAGMNIRLWTLNVATDEDINIDAATTASSTANIDTATLDASPDTVMPMEPIVTEDMQQPIAANDDGSPSCAPTPTLPILNKPTYVDVANSQDTKCLLRYSLLAFGGTYDFTVVDTTAPKEANRDVLELPERAANLLASGRKLTREIKRVISTPEGVHTLLVLSDGSVLHYRRSKQPNPTDGMCEVTTLNKTQSDEVVSAWRLRRVGSQGHTVLLRSIHSQGNIEISVKTLSSLLPYPEGEKPVSCDMPRQVTVWHSSGGYFLSPTSSNSSNSSSSSSSSSLGVLVPPSAQRQVRRAVLNFLVSLKPDRKRSSSSKKSSRPSSSSSSLLKSPAPDTPGDEGAVFSGGADGLGQQMDRKFDFESSFEGKNEAVDVKENSILTSILQFNSPEQQNPFDGTTIHAENVDTGAIRSAAEGRMNNANVLEDDEVVVIPYKRPSSSKKRKKVEISDKSPTVFEAASTEAAVLSGTPAVTPSGSNSINNSSSINNNSNKHARTTPSGDQDLSRLVSAGDGSNPSPIAVPVVEAPATTTTREVRSRSSRSKEVSFAVPGTTSSARLRALKDSNIEDIASITTTTGRLNTRSIDTTGPLRALQLGPAPRVNRNWIDPVASRKMALLRVDCRPPSVFVSACDSVIDNWQFYDNSCSQSVMNSGDWQMETYALQRLSIIANEQARLRDLIIIDVIKCLKAQVRRVCNDLHTPASILSGEHPPTPHLLIPMLVPDVISPMVQQYRSVAVELLQRQSLDLTVGISLDCMFSSDNGGALAAAATRRASSCSSSGKTSVYFSYDMCFDRAMQLQQHIHLMLHNEAAAAVTATTTNTTMT